jgi:hypothetical protein
MHHTRCARGPEAPTCGSAHLPHRALHRRLSPGYRIPKRRRRHGSACGASRAIRGPWRSVAAAVDAEIGSRPQRGPVPRVMEAPLALARTQAPAQPASGRRGRAAGNDARRHSTRCPAARRGGRNARATQRSPRRPRGRGPCARPSPPRSGQPARPQRRRRGRPHGPARRRVRPCRRRPDVPPHRDSRRRYGSSRPAAPRDRPGPRSGPTTTPRRRAYAARGPSPPHRRRRPAAADPS